MERTYLREDHPPTSPSPVDPAYFEGLWTPDERTLLETVARRLHAQQSTMLQEPIGSAVVYLCEEVGGQRYFMAHSLLSGIVRAKSAEALAHLLCRTLLSD